jgi:NodT family efflux transporter outer membrane factor (OMF) lipoprotein
MPRTSHLVLLALALPLAACDLGPDYARPQVAVPAAFQATVESAQAAWPSEDWWRGFESPELTQLILQARANNQNLAAAAARVVQADAQARIAGAPLLPSLSASGSGTYTRSGSRAAGAVAGVSSGGTAVIETREYGAAGVVSYEADFWGKNRALFDSAKATALYSRFDQANVALTVLTSVAQTYFNALGAADELAVTERNLKDARETLKVYQVRTEVGTATALDIAQQEALVRGIEAQIPNLRSQRDQNVIALATLVGRPPESIRVQADTLATLSAPVVSAGLPSELLARRPDVASAEAQLVAQNGNVRSARAAFFPDLQLTVQGGVQSLALSSLLGPGSVLFSTAGTLTQPIFNNGQLQGNLDVAKGRFAELVADYRQATLQAFQDAETYLTAVRYATEQEALAKRAVDVAQRAEDIARAQLAAGTVDITTVLNTQTTLFSDQTTFVQARLARFQAVINLYKALGGGWTLPGQIGAT